jgi:hypothetical protein
MIIDVHSHAWNFPSDFSDDFLHQAGRARPGVKVDMSATYEAYRATAPDDTCTIVFGGKANLSGLWVDDKTVADYVAKDPARLIGFLSVDPTQEGWEREMRVGHEELGLRGIKLPRDHRCAGVFLGTGFFEVVVVIAGVGREDAVVDVDDLRGEAADEMHVMADEDERAFKLLQAPG